MRVRSCCGLPSHEWLDAGIGIASAKLSRAAGHVRVLGVMALMNLGFICFALFTSNPFLRLIPMTPADGADLNPLLQDFGLIVLHPPLLYVGYVGLACAVCLCWLLC